MQVNDWLMVFNTIAGVLMMVFLVLAFWIEVFIPIFVGLGSFMALINFFVNDYIRSKRLDRLEEMYAKTMKEEKR